ncbi:hypothetical protein D3C81_1156620 [compost metagenome]
MRVRYGSAVRLRASTGSTSDGHCRHNGNCGSRIDTAGSQPMPGMENSSTRPMASKKPGVALSRISADSPQRSSRLSRRRARLTPSSRATGTTSANTPISRAKVWPKRPNSSCATGTCESSEMPRSPRNAAPSQRRYCTRIGWSRPSCRCRVRMLSSGASGPRITRAGSEGSAWVAMNTTRLITQAVSNP